MRFNVDAPPEFAIEEGLRRHPACLGIDVPGQKDTNYFFSAFDIFALLRVAFLGRAAFSAASLAKRTLRNLAVVSALCRHIFSFSRNASLNFLRAADNCSSAFDGLTLHIKYLSIWDGFAFQTVPKRSAATSAVTV